MAIIRTYTTPRVLSQVQMRVESVGDSVSTRKRVYIPTEIVVGYDAGIDDSRIVGRRLVLMADNKYLAMATGDPVKPGMRLTNEPNVPYSQNIEGIGASGRVAINVVYENEAFTIGTHTMMVQAWVEIDYVLAIAPPEKITLAKTQTTTDEPVAINWTEGAAAESYELQEQEETGAGAWTDWLTIQTGTDRSAAVYAPATAGRSKRYRVRSLNGNESSEWAQSDMMLRRVQAIQQETVSVLDRYITANIWRRIK